MPSLNEELLDGFTTQTVDIMRVESSIRKKVLGIMKKLEIDLISQIENIDPTGVSAESYKLNRLNTLLKQTKDTIRTSYRELRKNLTGYLTELSMIENLATLDTLNAAIGVDIATVAFPRSVALSLARNVQIEGAIPSEWWTRQAASLQRSFSDQISMGLLEGEPLNTLVQRIRGKSTGKRNAYWINDKKRIYTEFAGGIMDTGTRQAEALVRTSVQAVTQDARFNTFKENRTVIKGVAASVTFDLKTSDICIGRSGFAWDFDGNPLNGITTESFPGSPPWHWNCRTQLTAVTYSWKELAQKNKSKLGRGPKNLKASMDGAVAGDQTYSQWLKKKTKKQQQQVLGVAKQKMFKQGKLSLRELTDQTGKSLSVQELKNKIKKRKK